jgi:hypothetical protein
MGRWSKLVQKLRRVVVIMVEWWRLLGMKPMLEPCFLFNLPRTCLLQMVS